MSMRKNIKTMLADSHDPDSVSSKRVITFIAFIFCCIAFIANLFFGYKMDAFIYETMAYIVLGGIGITGIEKFADRKPPATYDYNMPAPRNNRWDEKNIDFHP